jgi:hypothetical protein
MGNPKLLERGTPPEQQVCEIACGPNRKIQV